MTENKSVPFLLALALCGPARAEDDPLTPENDDDRAVLEPMEIHPAPDLLNDSLRRRQRELETDPPCPLCDPEWFARQKDLSEQIADVVTAVTGYGLAPPNPDFEQRREHRIDYDWRRYERHPQMNDEAR